MNKKLIIVAAATAALASPAALAAGNGSPTVGDCISDGFY